MLIFEYNFNVHEGNVGAVATKAQQQPVELLMFAKEFEDGERSDLGSQSTGSKPPSLYSQSSLALLALFLTSPTLIVRILSYDWSQGLHTKRLLLSLHA